MDGQKQLQDGMRKISVLGFGVLYIRGLTVGVFREFNVWSIFYHCVCSALFDVFSYLTILQDYIYITLHLKSLTTQLFV